MFDIVICGMGVSNGPILEELAREHPAARVLVVDRGQIEHPHHLRTARDVNLGLDNDDFVEFVDGLTAPLQVPRWWATPFAGGGSLVWYGQLSRFRPSDFSMGDIARSRAKRGEDYSSVLNWPIKYEDLAPYYDEIERRLQPYGVASSSCDVRFLRERPHLTHFESEVMSRLAGVGFRPYSGATVLGGRRWEEEPVDPLTCQPHVGAPLQVRTNWYARNWEASSGLDWTIRGRSRVARVLTNAGRVTGVLLREHRRDGLVDEVIHAPMVVLGCGALESTALLLRSDIEDASGMMGRNITFTTEFVGYIKTDIRRSTAPHDVLGGRFANVSLRDDYDAPSADLLKGGKYALWRAVTNQANGAPAIC